MEQTLKTIRSATLSGILTAALLPAWVLGGLPGHASAVEAHEENGGIFTSQVPVDGSSIASGRAVIVVDKPIDEVLPIIVDYANYVQFMPNFTRSKVLAQRGNRAMVYMEVSVAKGVYTLYGQLNLAEVPQDGGSRVVEGRLLDGNINAFNASFKLTPVQGGAATEIDFSIYVDPDLPLPSSVFSRENERAAGRAVRALRTRIAETHGDSV
ncbi:MAG TPA: SRPBCC family protein [Polyangiales bacterium]|nr:SRPBCC family protein [Polyangiales bacterium]